MKKVLLLTIATLLLTACGGDDDKDSPTPSPTPTPAITVSLQNQTITDNAEIDAETTTELTLTYNVNVNIQNNSGITLNGSKLFANTNGKNVTIPLGLQDGKKYTLNIAEGCIVATDDSRAKAPAFTLTFKTKAKETPHSGGTDKSQISTTPIIASTKAAKTLYSYLLEQYGEKTISSVMADVNWNNSCAEKVHALTGKYPAMNCYDFIHIYVPENNWINYNNITVVKDWHNAGGIVQLMWHFNVPISETTQIKSDGSGVTCSPDKTTFRAKNIFIKGSWEEKWFYEQMDKVASVILKLQEEGIAATWRPFHEAAGNSNAKQQADWTKAWFWWGYDGADIYKKLWITMFDYFKQKGINNLIWIWTTQNYNGNSSQYRQDTEWYPGDQYVDMVARDLYGYNATKNKQEFIEIKARYPHKMVVLGECGQGNSIEAARPVDFWSAGALWGHFMVWYQQRQYSTDTMCNDEWWKAAMSDEYVITREQLPNL